MSIKVLEKSGRQIKNILQTSDPFKQNKCQNEDCFACKNSTKPTNCRKEGVIYNITCKLCQATYVGETSRNAYSRGKEHLNDFENNRDSSVMLRHCQLHHPNYDNNNPNFEMTVKQIYGNKCLDRQISESIQINSVPIKDRINTKIEFRQHKLPRAELSWE